MTSRQLYEAVIIELHKENAPNILLEDFNYFANKSINLYVNKRYNIYDINLQTTDDIRVLKATAYLTAENGLKPCSGSYLGLTTVKDGNGMATYEVDLPDDYLHILNCICIYTVHKTYKCYNEGDKWRCAAKRLTADAYSQVLDNFWNRPTYKNPYYYIHNVNLLVNLPTNPYEKEGEYPNYKPKFGSGTDANLYDVVDTNSDSAGQTSLDDLPNTDSGNQSGVGGFEPTLVNPLSPSSGSTNTNSGTTAVDQSATPGDINNPTEDLVNNLDSPEISPKYTTLELPKTIKIGGKELSTIEREAYHRYGNVSKVRMEIRYGTDNSIFELTGVYIDYIKTPQNIRLTQKQLDLTEDTSQMLEFPDYVCFEILNELVHIIMENITDPRLLTHPVVSLSIANPAQQLTEPVALATT